MKVYRTELGHKVIGCAIEVHKRLGPGLLESVYEYCLEEELKAAAVGFERQVAVPVQYRNANLGCAYRIDFIVEGVLLVELKAVDRPLPVHDAQVLTYMKLMKLRQGLLINFKVKLLKHGIKSFLL